MKSKKAFTLIEIMVYMSIMAIILILVFSLLINILKANRQIKAVTLMDQNERLIANYILNRVHNVDLIEPVVSPATDTYFYELPDVRWDMNIENSDLVIREVTDTGSGFPDQSTGTTVTLNSNFVSVDSLTLTPVNDGYGNENQGILVEITLRTTLPGDQFSHITRSIRFFASIR